MPRLVGFLLLLLVLPLSAEVASYAVRFDATDSALYVRACFAPGPAIDLYAGDREAPAYLLFAKYGDDTRARVQRRRIVVPDAGQRRCLRYGVDLRAATARSNLRRASQIGQDWLTSSSLWLWRPRSNLQGSRIRFYLPAGYAVSAPWAPLRGSDAFTFELDNTPSGWSNLVAFGPFQPTTLKIGRNELRLAVLSGASQRLNNDALQQWVQATGDAVAHIYGQLPLPSTQVLVVPIGRGKEPVPWAQVQRGGGSAVHLFVNETYSLDDFLGDWTAAHEFSHLFHPYLGGSGRWLAEGLASYYQNVTRARAGLMTERTAWQRLEDGFDRGRHNSTGLSLKQANRRMREEQKYMRVYWSGAAIALLADVELRRISKGATSLDSVLAEFGACHLPSHKRWEIEEFLSRLDELAGADVFIPIYRRHADSRRFPDVKAAYDHLGLSAIDGAVHLSTAPDHIAMRHDIMRSNDTHLASCQANNAPIG